MSERVLAVNVDVDSLHLYHAIHGLPAEDATDAVWERGVPRFLELFGRLGLRATFFVVGMDLERDGPRRVAQEAVRQGHELASHSWSHPYDLVQRPEAEIARELDRAAEVVGRLRGAPVRGFRAPGYNSSPVLRRLLAERGYAYDSSALPSPPYFLARAAAIAAIRLQGRRSRSIVGSPAAAFGPRHPRRRCGMVEFPMTVLPGVRVPVIGTSLALLGPRTVALLGPVLARLRFVNLEFHGIDLLDGADAPSAALRRHQPDLGVPLRRKTAAYETALRAAARGAHNDTLEKLALRPW